MFPLESIVKVMIYHNTNASEAIAYLKHDCNIPFFFTNGDFYVPDHFDKQLN